MDADAPAGNQPGEATGVLGVLRPMRAEPGLLIHPTTDRRLATEHWLLATLPAPLRDRARSEWEQHRVAMLPLGGLFSAVRIPERLLTALSISTEAGCLDEFLAEALGGGPVICDPRFSRYYALVPAGMPATLHQMAKAWRALEVDCLGRGSYLGVPRLDAVSGEYVFASYWSVPMHSAAVLCNPLTVARLIAAGRHCVETEPEA
ncbi:hypothetical protein [Streptomyces lomondensis]|uniref:Uncharacterized protein n=1 Tax=Streptomyces lomondensis TaxID=68229 RepID=A0ABQ2XQA1_9ACTN|nr:hypothetical protein [Streptomyces lomondensis]MCF0081153.1 hypothetical protein [Streptomyces lomondensis]GGX26636.1 hypothetical protein GCM10010383_66540 [Streptomyces lomondensis]